MGTETCHNPIELKKELDQSQTSADQEEDQSSEDENELDSKGKL